MEGVPQGMIHEADSLTSAPWYRREPYLLFFPLGIVLSWAGVGHWLAFTLGWSPAFNPIFHAMTQIQGFLMAFAVGFLFTMIPRRTGTPPPALWEVAVCAIAPVATTVAAWYQQWNLTQVAWLVLAVVLVAFALRRFTSANARRRPPNGFVWIPLAIAMGIAGSVLTGVGAAAGGDLFWLHNVGQKLVLQGMFIGLVLGVGGLAFPLMTRGQAPADTTGSAADKVAMALHVGAAGLLIASFFLEVTTSVRAAMLLRAAIISIVLVGTVELWRLPDQPGSNRWLIWIAGWMLPAGYLVAGIWPAYWSAGLHLSFVAGFALLTLGVGAQVVLGHGGYREMMLGRPWQLTLMGGLVAAAAVARTLMEFDRSHYYFWMGVASGCFIGATAVWLAFLLPKMIWRKA